MYCEEQFSNLLICAQRTAYSSEHIRATRQDCGGYPISRGSQVREYKAIQQLHTFSGDRTKFREWNEKLLNSLAQVKHGYRKPLKNLNNKLDTMDGAIPEEEADGFVRLMNGRLTLNEYQKASRTAREADDARGDYELDESDMAKYL